MRELSLFTGAGGGVLASKLLGWTTAGYVEINEYCQKVIRQRIADGILDPAPIFGDIRKFISEGYARSYQGMVDVVTAGFPCQPFSVAGKSEGEFDPRNMWPETIRVIREVGPAYAFLENVPGLLAHPYFGTILGELAEAGLDAEWDVFSACEVGASHPRERVFILANARRFRGGRVALENGRADHIDRRPPESIRGKSRDVDEFGDSYGGAAGWEGQTPWASQPRIDRVVHGLAYHVDRLETIGNGQVPIVAASAWKILSGLDWEAD